jgi:tRNA U34 5-methylaminomethyl-2-thiouridine-forming methyltransferase MnmC
VERFHIAELGFGTGLNLIETWRQWIAVPAPGQQLKFTSFEAYPMAADDMARALNDGRNWRGWQISSSPNGGRAGPDQQSSSTHRQP